MARIMIPRKLSLRLVLTAQILLIASCGRPMTEVDHPFYLGYFETRDQMALFRCPSGRFGTCAIDGLPGPTVYAAGANDRHVVVQASQGYFYFARIPQEAGGWGNNPERIVGPLTEEEFERAKARLGLPDFSVRP